MICGVEAWAGRCDVDWDGGEVAAVEVSLIENWYAAGGIDRLGRMACGLGVRVVAAGVSRGRGVLLLGGVVSGGERTACRAAGAVVAWRRGWGSLDVVLCSGYRGIALWRLGRGKMRVRGCVSGMGRRRCERGGAARGGCPQRVAAGWLTYVGRGQAGRGPGVEGEVRKF